MPAPVVKPAKAWPPLPGERKDDCSVAVILTWPNCYILGQPGTGWPRVKGPGMTLYRY